ncbi:hypothetical protein [Pseudophaeobacter sp.]|jgi:peptidoglycan hydrolase CwlO-like protein|uniref:hypothetical protein n=1 Tax=Pseudophaeobacter sp. TaxID=1971739 RepID=UPI0032D8DBF6
MARHIVKFLAGYSRYNKGETAAFDEEKAKQLCAGKSPVAEMVGPVKETSSLSQSVAAVIGSMSTEDIDLLDREREELTLAGKNIADQLASLDRREQELAAGVSGLEDRERDLAARELALTERAREIEAAEVSNADPAPADKAESEASAEAKGKTPGAPPKQGAKS